LVALPEFDLITDDGGKTPYDSNLPSAISELIDLTGDGSDSDEEESRKWLLYLKCHS
jgi:hypothetical protein